MDDKFGVESNTNLNLIVFDEQEKVRIGAALQALADQMVPSVERQPFSYHNVDEYNDESQGSSYAKTNKQKNFGYSTTNNPKQKDETLVTFPSFDSTCISIRNEDEAEVDSNQVHLSTNELLTHNILTKEEPQLQEFKIEYPESEPQGNQNDEPESDIEYKSVMHYCCPECGVDCGPYSNWIIHTEKQHEIAWPRLNSVNGESFYQCLYCNKKLSHKMRVKLVQEHHINHMPHRDYLKCGFCDKRFHFLNTVYPHLKAKHAKLAHPYLQKKYSNPKMEFIKIFCPICQQSQPNIKRWEQHLLEEHDYENKIKSQVTPLGNNIYSCHLCQKKISQAYRLKLHMLLHEPNKSFQCILCKKYDSHLSPAVLHVNRNHHSLIHQNKPFKCSYCKLSFARAVYLWRHNKNFHNNEQSRYTDIKNSFSSNEDEAEVDSNQVHLSTNELLTHNILTKEEPQLQEFKIEYPVIDEETFSAHTSNFSYSNDIEPINMQYISESGLSENTCSNEKDNEDSVDSIESESQDNPNDEPESVIAYKSLMHYNCPECGVDCGPYSNWIIHIEKQHKIAWPNLNSVTKVNGESFYQCLYCNKKLNHKIGLKLLQEHHIKHMPHKYYLRCGFCDKSFKVVNSLYLHLRQTHSKLAPTYLRKKNPKMKYIKIFCPICQKSQPNIKRWEQHLLEEHDYENKIKSQVTPLGKNMYSCHLCQKKIRQTYKLKPHMLLHEPNQSFQCKLCKQYDTHLSAAVLHIDRNHTHIHQNKLFECSYCKLTFSRGIYLWRHKQNFHNNEQSKHSDIKNSFSSNQNEAEVDSNQGHLSTNELLTYNILTKEEPQLQELKIEYPVIDEETLSACSEDLSNSNEKESANTEYISDVK